MAVLKKPSKLLYSVSKPTPVLKLPSSEELFLSALLPIAVLPSPNALVRSALKPTAVLSLAIAFNSASSPRTVLLLVKQPCWQVARASGASGKQANASEMSSKASGQYERFIEYVNGRVV